MEANQPFGEATENFIYEEPSWSSLSKTPFYLDRIRQGSILQSYLFDKKPYYIIGSCPDICDLVYENSTVSPRHAVLQFNAKDEAFIMDLRSADGTWVRNQRIKPLEYVPVNDSDQIIFGDKDQARTVFVVRKEADEILDGNRNDLSRMTQTVEEKLVENKRIFDESGKLVASAIQSLFTREEKYKNSASGASVPKEESVSSVYFKFFNPEKGYFDVSNFRKSAYFSNLNSEQLELLNKIDMFQKKIKHDTIKTKERFEYEDGDSDDDDNFKTSETNKPWKIQGQSYQELQELVTDLLSSLHEDESVLTLSDFMKSAIDDRLFDEGDSFYDRTDPDYGEASTTLDQPSTKEVANRIIELDKKIQEKEGEIQKLQTLVSEAKAESDDLLEIYMKENQLSLEEAELNNLKQQKSALQQPSQNTPESTSLRRNNQKRSVNRAMLQASNLMALIAYNHEIEAGKRRKEERNQLRPSKNDNEEEIESDEEESNTQKEVETDIKEIKTNVEIIKTFEEETKIDGKES